MVACLFAYWEAVSSCRMCQNALSLREYEGKGNLGRTDLNTFLSTAHTYPHPTKRLSYLPPFPLPHPHLPPLPPPLTPVEQALPTSPTQPAGSCAVPPPPPTESLSKPVKAFDAGAARHLTHEQLQLGHTCIALVSWRRRTYHFPEGLVGGYD